MTVQKEVTLSKIRMIDIRYHHKLSIFILLRKQYSDVMHYKKFHSLSFVFDARVINMLVIYFYILVFEQNVLSKNYHFLILP